MIKKAQSAIEFVIILGAIVFFFTMFLMVVQHKLADKAYEQRDEIINDVVLAMQQEISIAERASDGYERNFELPKTILNIDYEITIDGLWVYAITDDGAHAISLPVGNVTGQPQPGSNIIKKLAGIVYLN